MRKSLPLVLVFLGVFLIAFAILGFTYTGNGLQKTPLDTDSTTRLSGTASLSGGAPFAVKATSITRADAKKSDGSVVVFENSSCLVKDIDNPPNCVAADDPQERLLSASTDKFATNRKTGLAVQDRKYVAADAGEHKGLINKFPFDVQKKTYPFWNGTADKVLDAKYSGTATLDGLKTYKFVTQANELPIEIAEGVPGTYTDTTTMYIDPTTGAIVNQVTDQQRASEDGSPVLDLKYGFTKAQAADNIKTAKANASKLGLVSTTLPIIALILGLVALAGGVLLSRRAAAGDGGTYDDDRTVSLTKR